MKQRLVVDTNIILRFLLGDDEVLSGRATSIFREAEEGKFTVYLDEVVVAEAVWVLSSFYKVKKAAISEKLIALVSQKWIAAPRKKLMLAAISFYQSSNLHYIDCWLIAVSESMKAPLETFDIKLKRVKAKH